MKPERDDRLGARLQSVLPSPEARYGSKARLRRELDGRLVQERRAVLPAFLATAGLLALVLTCAIVLVHRNRGIVTTSRNRGSSVTLTTARILLRSDAELIVERDDPGGTILRLVAGTMFAHVQKGTGRSFSVIAGRAHIHVVGTIFGVSRLPLDQAAVEVVEGVVAVDTSDGSHLLRAGERFPVSAEEFRPTAAEWPLLAEPPAAAQPAHALPTAPSSGVVDAGSGVATEIDGASRGVVRRRAQGRATMPSGRTDAYTGARDLEREGDVDGALAAYAVISKRRDPNAEDALFAIVRLRAQRGENALVVSAVQDYRTAFPDGRYARAADVHAVNARLALSDDIGVLRETDAFLARYSLDPRAFRFHLARATVLARRGDCARALPELEQVPDSEAKHTVTNACGGVP